jgi:hypothetical protein
MKKLCTVKGLKTVVTHTHSVSFDQKTIIIIWFLVRCKFPYHQMASLLEHLLNIYFKLFYDSTDLKNVNIP